MRMICLEVTMRRRIPLGVAWENCAGSGRKGKESVGLRGLGTETQRLRLDCLWWEWLSGLWSNL